MHADTPNLRQDQEPVVQSRPVAILLEGEGVEAVAPLEAREACFLAALDASEERLIRLVESRQRVLQDMAVNGGVLRKLRAYLLQLGFLLEP
jgi:hypothetical protein